MTAWLVLGVRDNLLHPEMNGAYTAQVLQMDRLRQTYPEDFERIKHQCITDPATQALLFRAIVAMELVVSVVMVTGAGLMIGAIFGLVEPETAKTVALLGAFGFTSIWASFSSRAITSPTGTVTKEHRTPISRW